MMMSGRKPLCHNGFRHDPQLAADFRETPQTVFKTVEGAKVPWRVRFPSASATTRAHGWAAARVGGRPLGQLGLALVGTSALRVESVARLQPIVAL